MMMTIVFAVVIFVLVLHDKHHCYSGRRSGFTAKFEVLPKSRYFGGQAFLLPS